MADDSQFTPNWDESDAWDEFEWEQALKYSDHVAARYFRMLSQYGDLPDADSLIAAKLGDQNLFDFEEVDYDWAGEEDEELDADLDQEDEPDDDDGDDEGEDDEPIRPGDSLYFETSPIYQRARQIALGWCNILASVLTAEDRFWGLTVLFHMGRLLSYLAYSIGDGTFHRPDASIAFAKRALYEVNLLLGELSGKATESPKYKVMFNMVRDYLLEAHDMLVTYVDDCRKRRNDEEALD